MGTWANMREKARTMANGDHRIDIARERVIAFADAPREIPRRRGGKRVAVATLHRWSRKGLNGIRLETIQVAGTRCTSIEALQRFFDRLTVLREAEESSSRTSTSTLEGQLKGIRLQGRLRRAAQVLDLNPDSEGGDR